MQRDKSSSLADKLFPNVVERDIEILDIPPEERRLNTETYDFTVSTINDYIKDNHIIIPKFQRGYVWNRSQASRLIESLIIQCPIPVIFLSQNSDESLSVIDGNQRLNSINLYLKDDFALKGLTAYPEIEGYKFTELDPRFQRHILNRTIRCIVILKDTHPQIKFDVFERLNTGSAPLTAQELRHGIHNGPLMDLLEKLSKDKHWLELSGNRGDKRMKGDELILRFFALSEGWRNYSKPMVSFLNSYAERNRKVSDNKIDELEHSFSSTFNKCYLLLDNLIYKTFDNNFKNIKFNAALFDAQMVSIFELNPNSIQIEKIDKRKFRDELSKLLSDDTFSKYISSGTTDKTSVLERIRLFKVLIQKYL
jgi:uncharacterized protein with ParB-like and HNH nuclease domain